MKLSLPAAKTWHTGWMGYPGHRGQDFGWGDGDQVLAAAPGTIVEVYAGGGYNGGWGNRVVISHGGNNHTTYNHLSTGTIAVTVDQTVTRGQLLARMGATGNVTGKHLHFELELGGRGPSFRVDPEAYYDKHLPGTGSDPAPRARKKATMSTLYYKAKSGGGTIFALAGDSPGTTANWLETEDQKFANELAETHGNAKQLSAGTWDAWKARYLEAVKTVGGASTTVKAEVDAAAISKVVLDEAAKRLLS